MLFQVYGSQSGWQLFGWILVFACLIITNEIARRRRALFLRYFANSINCLFCNDLYLCCSGAGVGIA